MLSGYINSIKPENVCPTVRVKTGISAAVALGFMIIFNDASLQKQALRRVCEEYKPRDGKPHEMACAFHTARSNDNRLTAKIKCTQEQPLFASEMIAVVKDLAHRVVVGSAHVTDLLSMLESLEKMGIDVHGLFSSNTTLLGPRFGKTAALRKTA